MWRYAAKRDVIYGFEGVFLRKIGRLLSIEITILRFHLVMKNISLV